MKRLRQRVALPVAAACVTAAVAGTPAAAAPHGTFAPSAASVAVAHLVATTGADPARAAHVLAVQRAGAAKVQELDRQLGARSAGGYLDPRTGSAVVNVLDARAAETVRAAGATPRSVRYGTAELTSVQAALQPVPNTSTGLDPVADQVVLTVSDAAPADRVAGLLGTARAFGDRVRVDRAHGVFQPLIYDGDEISNGQSVCSAGFNSNKGGRNYIVDAGHCAQGLPYWQGIGPTVDARFPGTDYSLIRNDSGDAPGAVNLYDGSTQPITAAGDATVGEQICKSGRTTEVTCGSVQALNETVDYGDGQVVRGMVKTDTHADHGDSGGPWYDGATGLGMTGAGDTVSVTWFQPLTAALRAYGVTLNR
ncbi:S1 family peptidase [Amycolatopsis sp. NPDC059021]|uniref:S1 family peptidase n=1 Tax=Amycolatopsis sp. NPDC059021 TaxID=3346704 RepID=UPI00366F9B6D